MLIVRKPTFETEGQWFKFRIRGEEVELKIRPLAVDVYNKIRKAHKTVKLERDPQTKQAIKVEVFDEESITEDLLDYLLEDFKGFGSDAKTPLEVTKENKKLIFEIPSASDEEMSMFDFVFTKAKDIAALSEEEFARQEKN